MRSQLPREALERDMRLVRDLKARFPKLFPDVIGVLALGTIGGVAAYERSARASDSCCYPGSPCCHPGSPCCDGDCCEKGAECCTEGAACCTTTKKATAPSCCSEKE